MTAKWQRRTAQYHLRRAHCSKHWSTKDKSHPERTEESAQTFSGTVPMEQGYFLVQTLFAFNHRYQQHPSIVVGVSSSTDYFNSVLPSPQGTQTQNLTQKKSWRLCFWGSVDLVMLFTIFPLSCWLLYATIVSHNASVRLLNYSCSKKRPQCDLTVCLGLA